MVADVEGRELSRVVVDRGDLGEGDESVADTEELDDPQVLLGLRLPTLGGGHDEQAGVDGAHSRQHVLDEAHVTRHVDEGEGAPRRQRGPRETEVYGEAPLLLLCQAVGVHTREGLHERRLAVVDVPGGADYVHAVTALATTGSSAGWTVRRSIRVRSSRVRAITGGSWARRAAVTSPSTATPAEGMSRPGSDPAPAMATVSTG